MNILANAASLFGAGIILAIGIVKLSIAITILIIKAIIDYTAKRIGKEVSKNFDYDYLAKMIAYEATKTRVRVEE